MAGPQLNTELLQSYAEDSEANFYQMEELLMEHEDREFSPDAINALYRSLHSLKGNSAMVGVKACEALAHAAEDLVSLARDHDISLDDHCLEALLQSLDLFRSLTQELFATQTPPSPDKVQHLVEVFRKLYKERSEGLDVHDELPEELAGGFLFDEVDDIDLEISMIDLGLTPEPTTGPTKETPQPQVDEPEIVAPSQAAGANSAPKTPVNHIRVPTDNIQTLITLVGELSLAAGALLNKAADSISKSDYHRFERLMQDLRDSSSSLALVPASELSTRMRRLVRELKRATGKELRLEVSGGETKLDKQVVDRLADPLMHLVRNCADHGLEESDARKAVGKDPVGTIRLDCIQNGNEVQLTIGDDGAGLNREKILNHARGKGIFAENAEPPDETIWKAILHPGFSTADQVSALSGRGVGMDVVQTEVSSLRGRIQIETTPGKGTNFIIHLPLSLAFTYSISVRVQDIYFVIPLASINKIFRPTQNQIHHSNANRQNYLNIEDRTVPVVWLEDLYGLPRPKDYDLTKATTIAIQTATLELAIPVDELLGTGQVSLQPLLGPLNKMRGVAGTSILPSGQIAVAVDCDRLAKEVQQSKKTLQ